MLCIRENRGGCIVLAMSRHWLCLKFGGRGCQDGWTVHPCIQNFYIDKNNREYNNEIMEINFMCLRMRLVGCRSIDVPLPIEICSVPRPHFFPDQPRQFQHISPGTFLCAVIIIKKVSDDTFKSFSSFALKSDHARRWNIQRIRRRPTFQLFQPPKNT
jgi:hypothetical protein